MLSIGEFSKVTQLTIKALRLYHEKGILIPTKVDLDSNYRYYKTGSIEKGLIIKRLKDMGFSLNEISVIIRDCSDDSDLMRHVEEKLKEINRTISEFEELRNSLSVFLDNMDRKEKEGDKMKSFQEVNIEREIIPDVLMCGIRFKGQYHEVGVRFGTLFRKCGRFVQGKPFSMYYDGEYKEEGADIEACVTVKKPVTADGIDCRELKGGKAVTILHAGPYEEIGRSYARLYEFCRENNLKVILPGREYYLKGPGMIFRGNPAKYITKIVMLYE